MKDILAYGAVALGAAAFTWAVMLENHCKQMRQVETYIQKTDKLLEEVEFMCRDTELSWGETVCKSNTWDEFLNARFDIDLGDLTFDYDNYVDLSIYCK